MIYHSLNVTTQSHDYPIVIGENLFYSLDNCLDNSFGNNLDNNLNKSFDFSPFIIGEQVLIVSNDTVAPLYLSQLQTTLKSQLPNANILTCILPDGEQHKTLDSIHRIYDSLMTAHFNRDCTLIALGGGVIGDITGFAAATYMRGVNFIQIPTTLLSQVDSSVGGKTGINHPLGKNMIGAFWQPRLVVADMATLKTLPERELSAGLAEVIKYALIGDKDFLAFLEKNIPALVAKDMNLLAETVKICCQHKAEIVAEDEFEAGKRALLNFGHTFGHVIETHEGYGTWLHGEAVAVGMLQACHLSQRLGWLQPEQVQRVKTLLQQAKLPVQPPAIGLDTALTLMQHDKKVKAGQIRLILLKDLGKKAIITADYPTSDLQAVLMGQ